jgi:hypothetical protein
MAVQREIVDKDGNRLAVVQGGAGKAAVYGKTTAGEWVPLQVDADGRAVLNVVVEQGAAGEDPWLVQLSGTIPVIYISRLEDRPSATEVEIGQFVILTDEELSTWVSNGVNWVEVL